MVTISPRHLLVAQNKVFKGIFLEF